MLANGYSHLKAMFAVITMFDAACVDIITKVYDDSGVDGHFVRFGPPQEDTTAPLPQTNIKPPMTHHTTIIRLLTKPPSYYNKKINEHMILI